MNENDINDLLNSALGGNTARQDFKNQLLQNSTNAFNRGRLFHKRLKITGFVVLIAIITTAAFFSGRLSVNKETSHQQQIARQTNSDDNNISVSKDLVAWLDAAKFFTQLGMPERAEFSYKQASQLIPTEIPQNNIVNFGQNSLVAQEEISNKKNPNFYKNKINKILAQNFGD
ncbi:MAG: hypothetical protein JW787_03610 [Sedimentisphaerales bacterium]|nr:hypothetical protein [Sedimentisphaerales bacterium]